jgi:hypothetical protein
VRNGSSKSIGRPDYILCLGNHDFVFDQRKVLD